MTNIEKFHPDQLEDDQKDGESSERKYNRNRSF